MVCVPKKKLKNKSLKIVYSTTKDFAISYLFNNINIPINPIIYSIVTFNPIEIAISAAIIKLGLPKVAVLIVLAFLA
jgi:hypothetical protein